MAHPPDPGPTGASRGRILVVEDHPATSRFMVRVLERAGFVAEAAADADEARRHLRGGPFDAALFDVRLPGTSGFDLVAEVRVSHPGLSVALMTAYTGPDVVERVRRSGVDAFLAKPIEPNDLVAQVDALVSRGRAAARRRDRVLAVGAHPGDVEVGAGGTLLHHRDLGDEVVIVALTAGGHGASPGGADEGHARQRQARRAAERLGARLVLNGLPPGDLPADGPTVQVIRDAVADLAPTVVYAHSRHELDRDHRAAHAAAVAAAGEVPALYCYETAATTAQFLPARFVPVDPVVEAKCEVLAAYGSGTGDPLHLDPELAWAACRYWGRLGGSRFCEAFEVVRAGGERGRYASDSLVTDR